LPLVILTILNRRPMNSYRLLYEIETLFDGAYEPSTGAIYPAVSALRHEGLIASEEGGVSRTYRLTARGRRALDARRDDIARLELRTGSRLVPDDAMESLLRSFVERVRELAPRLARMDLEDVLNRTTDQLVGLSERGRNQ
jgi:DNA-binding PadR family transcriptional regulator